jgi:cation transport regulator ChaC
LLNMANHLYFAYGSCMNLRDIRRTTPAEFVSAATLFDYKLAFTRYSKGRKGGVADVVKASGDYVEGVLFRIKDLKALDAREGAPYCYKRGKVKVLVHETMKFVNVWTYEVVNKEGYEIEPSEHYKRLIKEGAQQFLSKEYVIDLEDNLSRFRAPYDLSEEFANDYDYRLNSLRERLLF